MMDYPCGKSFVIEPFWFYRVDRQTDGQTDTTERLNPTTVSKVCKETDRSKVKANCTSQVTGTFDLRPNNQTVISTLTMSTSLSTL